MRRNETYKLPIILPEQLKNKYVVNDKNVASFNNNVITGVNVGTTSTTLDSTISNITINVYDMTSNKYKINNDEKYIYTKNDTDLNTILSNIDFQYINGKIEDNKLILYHDDVVEEEYKIINITAGNKLSATAKSEHCFTDQNMKPIRVKNSHPDIFKIFSDAVEEFKI